MQTRGRGFDAGGDFETIYSVTVFLLLGIEDAEAVISRGVLLVNLEDC